MVFLQDLGWIMKKTAFLIIILFVILFNQCLIFSNTLYTDTDLTRIEFSMEGDPIIYSNYPETIYEEGGMTDSGQPLDKKLCINQIGTVNGEFYGIGKHFVKTDIQKNKKYSAEIYNGRIPGNSQSYIFGIAFLFDGQEGESANVTIYKAGQQNSIRVNSILKMSLDTAFNYYNSDIYKNYSSLGDEYSKPRMLSLNGKDAKVAIFEEIKDKKGYANCRIQFSSDKNIKVVEFYAVKDALQKGLLDSGLTVFNQNSLDKANLYEQIYEISKDENRVKKLEDYPKLWTTTSAVLNYDRRKASFDAPVGTKFCLSNAGHIKRIRDLNINEYEYLSENDFGGFPYNGNRIHDGNYSIEYDIHLKGAGGKKLKIIPYKEEGKSISSGAILYNSIYNFWYYPEPNEDYWIMPIPADGQFKFVLPGSVYGDIQFEVLEGSENYSITLDKSYDLWAENSIARALSLGIVPYELQKNYNIKISRREFCGLALQLFLKRQEKSFDEYIEENKVLFNDNFFSDTNNRYTLLAFKLGIVNGVGNNKFEPERNITRQEAAVMLDNLYNILNIKNFDEKSCQQYIDNDKIASWAKDSVYRMSSFNVKNTNTSILNGVGNNKFNPLENYTRQESIATVLRMYEMF